MASTLEQVSERERERERERETREGTATGRKRESERTKNRAKGASARDAFGADSFVGFSLVHARTRLAA